MAVDDSTTIRVRESTRQRLYALRRTLEGAEQASIDEIIDRLVGAAEEKPEAFRAPRSRAST